MISVWFGTGLPLRVLRSFQRAYVAVTHSLNVQLDAIDSTARGVLRVLRNDVTISLTLNNGIQTTSTGIFLGSASHPMRTLERAAAEVETTDLPVLIVGEGGTRKGTLALIIHKLSTSELDETNRITGTLSLLRDWSHGAALMEYVGGSDLYLKNSGLHDQFHQLSVSEALRDSRWNFGWKRQLTYLPQSSFGFNPEDVIGSGLPSGNLAGAFWGLNSFVPPNVIERTFATDASVGYVLGLHSALALDGSFDVL